MNLGIFTGNLGRDPELRQHNGDNVLGFPIGVQVGTRDKPQTMWIDCAIWGLIALIVQVIVYYLLRLTIPNLSERIANGELAAALWLGFISVAAGMLSAASMAL